MIRSDQLAKLGLLFALTAQLAACGGGGSDNPASSPAASPGTSTPSAPAPGTPPTIAASQASANALVAAVNAGVADVRTANTASSLPGGALVTALPSGATTTGSINCSTLGTAGSGSISYTYTYDGTTFSALNYSYVYSNCSFTNSGYTYTINGTGTLNYDRFTSSSDYSFTYAQDFTYAFSGPSINESGRITGTETCTSVAGRVDCAYKVGNNTVSSVSLSTSGTVTTVSDAKLVNGTFSCDYNTWVYDSATGRATSGSVTISDGSKSATVTATGSGYTVSITISGQTTTYAVAY